MEVEVMWYLLTLLGDLLILLLIIIFFYLGNVVEMKNPVATGNSQISFTDQVLNMKEFTSLIQSEATGPSNTTQQTGTY